MRADDEPGDVDFRARIASELGLAPDRVVTAPSVASIHLALFYVLADAGDEVLVLGSADSTVGEAARISGLDVQAIADLDAESLFESAGERTRAIVIEREVDPEVIELLAELDLPIVSSRRIAHRIYETADAPLLALVGSRSSIAWLAVLGPADRAEPLLTRLEPFARVFFTRDRGSS